MKTIVSGAFLFAALFSVSLLSSCEKDEDEALAPKEQLILGQWSINRIQLRLYYGGVFQKDTIIKQTPHPVNFVRFDTGNSFAYCFNSYTTNTGTYQFVGQDSVISVTPNATYRWKKLTLTDKLFTVVNTYTNDPAFPGATVEKYQTFVK